MPSNSEWVQKLVPAKPHGSDLLQQERYKSNVNVDELATFLFTEEALQRRAQILNILAEDPVFDKSHNYFQGREARIETSLARGKRLEQLRSRHQWTYDDLSCANDLISESTPYALHASMFLVTLRDQTTPEQKKLFYEKAERYEIIGCYAQTELGHGSNVRGLETTATWNPEDKTFTLHSPHLTSSKWWIGSLGMVANHAVVMAQLIIKGKNYGPHPFIVQIRDFKTHEPLENVCVGDIGPKFGFNTMDNGFLLFNHLKIPHVNMLARFSRVDPETSQYQRPSNPALLYGTMVWVRSDIVLKAGSVLARGVVIATRYCAVRRQFQDNDAKTATGENQVINYTMVQARLFPLLAAMFALHFTGRGMIRLYEENQKRTAAGQGTDLLPDLHATSCALKAYASTVAAEGLETCRRACGGHGYSSFSGIGSFYADYLPNVTWEGDNYMLTQQVARYLLKSARAVMAGKATDNDTSRILSAYFTRQSQSSSNNNNNNNNNRPAFNIFDSDKDLVDAFAWRVSFLTFEALRHRDQDHRSWNSLLVDFWRLSTAFAQYMVVKSFYEALVDPATLTALHPDTLAIFRKLFRLFALHNLEREATDFFSSGAASAKQIQLARTEGVMKLLGEVRPHAVTLVDAWKFSDWQLDSSLGRDDGRVYEDMFYRASELNPLNKVVVDPYPNSRVLIKKDGRDVVKSKL